MPRSSLADREGFSESLRGAAEALTVGGVERSERGAFGDTIASTHVKADARARIDRVVELCPSGAELHRCAPAAERVDSSNESALGRPQHPLARRGSKPIGFVDDAYVPALGRDHLAELAEGGSVS